MSKIIITDKDTVLAIDYGTVRIGLAISKYTLAEPLEIISNDNDKFTKLENICMNNDVKKIIVGMSENEMARKTEKFTDKLKDLIEESWSYKPTVEHVDETLSSYSVHKKLKSAKKSKRNAHIDHFAAAEFLQEWIDQHY